MMAFVVWAVVFDLRIVVWANVLVDVLPPIRCVEDIEVGSLAQRFVLEVNENKKIIGSTYSFDARPSVALF
jgi:hypothetical protein